MNLRIKKLITKLQEKKLDGLILNSNPNISYLTGFLSDASYLLVSKRENIYFTDFRYYQAVKQNLSGFLIKKINGSVFNLIAQACLELKVKNLAFEKNHLTFIEYKQLKEKLSPHINLIPISSPVEELRTIKTEDELKKIKKATEIAVSALEFIQPIIQEGKKEIEIAAELERFIRYKGGCSSSFEIIVASGPNSSFPHHRTSQRKIRNNELVLIDLGVDYFGYKSDLTRVFFLGKIKRLERKIYAIVRQAQARAIKKIKPGVKISKVDMAARQYIKDKGYGGLFGHSLGHGIGLEVHEAPRISSKNPEKLKTGMVFTVEPAIYLPNKFGIRLEDMVLVTKKGVDLISGTLHK